MMIDFYSIYVDWCHWLACMMLKSTQFLYVCNTYFIESAITCAKFCYIVNILCRQSVPLLSDRSISESIFTFFYIGTQMRKIFHFEYNTQEGHIKCTQLTSKVRMKVSYYRNLSTLEKSKLMFICNFWKC